MRGQRIELSEVKAGVMRIASKAKQAVCDIPRSGPYKGSLVCTYVRVGVDAPFVHVHASLDASAEIEKIVRQTLPVRGVPSVWLSVDALPLTASNKLDRRRVRQWLESSRVEDAT